MKHKRAKIFVAVLVTAVAMLAFTTVFVGAVVSAPHDEEMAFPVTATSSAAQISLPVSTSTSAAGSSSAGASSPALPSAHLIIPALSINAKIQNVGISTKGNIGIPTNFTDVGWYKYGPAPGEKGNAIIDGHVDNALALAGVFKHLGEIRIGDDVAVKDASGNVVHFNVTNITTYPYDEVPMEQILGANSTATTSQLVLITCGGTWVQSQKSYDERVVVTAVKS